MKIRTALIVAALCSMGGGCASPVMGPTILANADTIDSRAQQPAQATWVRRQNAQLSADGTPLESPASHSLNIAGPATNIVEIGPDGVSQAGSGPAGQAITLRQEDGTEIKAFSQTNLKAARRVTTAPDGTTTVEVTFDSDSASATRADAERLAAAAAIYQSFNEAQKQTILAAIERDRETWKQALNTAIPGLFDVIVQALTSQ